MIAEIIKEIKKNEKILKINDTSEITCKQVLSWAKRTEAQHTQKAMLESLKDSKDF